MATEDRRESIRDRLKDGASYYFVARIDVPMGDVHWVQKSFRSKDELRRAIDMFKDHPGYRFHYVMRNENVTEQFP